MLLVFYMILLTSVFLYRISFLHPLSQYPGPLLAKASRWYWTALALGGRQHIELQRLHGKYGDVVRIGELKCTFLAGYR